MVRRLSVRQLKFWGLAVCVIRSGYFTPSNQLSFARYKHTEKNKTDSNALAQTWALPRAKITCQHIRRLNNETLQHGCCPETLIVEFVERAITPPDGENREREIEQYQRIESKLEDACPIWRGGLTRIDIKENTEEYDLDENRQDEFCH